MMETPQISKSFTASTAYHGADFMGVVAGCAQAQIDSLILQKLQANNLQPQKVIMSTMRIVKVYIADPNINIPLDKRVLYSGTEQLTDLTDQELFFEVPISQLLKDHNELRAKTVDKEASKAKSQDIFLEPARIRDLRMVVVDIAKF